jgi:hypothetical protein
MGAHSHPTPKGVGPASGTMPSKVDCKAKKKQMEEEAAQKILAPGGRKSSLKKRTAAATPPKEDTTKTIRPTGASPMKESKEDDLKSLKETIASACPQQNQTPARAPPKRIVGTRIASNPPSQLYEPTFSRASCKIAQNPKKRSTQPPNQKRRRVREHLGST